jgi:LAO/AO transport system kinase
MLPGAGDDLQGIKRGLLELVDVIAVNKADGAMQSAAELAAGLYRDALHSLARRADNSPTVLTCSALHRQGIYAVWEIIERRQQRLMTTEELPDRRRRQNLRWCAVVPERPRTRRASGSHPGGGWRPPYLRSIRQSAWLISAVFPSLKRKRR